MFWNSAFCNSEFCNSEFCNSTFCSTIEETYHTSLAFLCNYFCLFLFIYIIVSINNGIRFRGKRNRGRKVCKKCPYRYPMFPAYRDQLFTYQSRWTVDYLWCTCWELPTPSSGAGTRPWTPSGARGGSAALRWVLPGHEIMEETTKVILGRVFEPEKPYYLVLRIFLKKSVRLKRSIWMRST
jgi:hypothetical protein